MSTMNGNERQEARHEYNLFLDREIQKRLLSVEDDEEEEAVYQRVASGDGLSSTCPTSATNWIRAKPFSLKNPKNAENFDAWCPESTKRIRKVDKQQQRSVNREREAPKWELISGKDSKSKDINVSFRHYADWRKYMEQYRKEHTYNSGSPETRDVDLGKLAASSVLDRAKQQQQQSRTPPNSAKATTTRTLSDPNILDLASRCRLNPTNVRSHSGDLSKRERDASSSRTPADNKPESASEPPPPTTTKCSPVGRSQHSFSMTAKGGNKSLAPLGGPQAGKMSSLTASSASAMKITPIGTTPKRLDVITQPGSMAASKRSRQTTTNGFLLDTNSSSRSVNNKSPPLLLPNSQLKTVDLLCHVSTIHKQKQDVFSCDGSDDADLDDLSDSNNDPDDSTATKCTNGELRDDYDISRNGTEVNVKAAAMETCQTLEALVGVGGASNEHVDGYNIVSIDPTFPGTLDQVSVLRRYMMDLAELEEDFELRDRLGSAPDVAFRSAGPRGHRRRAARRKQPSGSALPDHGRQRQQPSSGSAGRRDSATRIDLCQPQQLAKCGRAHAYFHRRAIVSTVTQNASVNMLHDHRFHNPLELPSMQSAKKSKGTTEKAGYSVIQGLNQAAQNNAIPMTEETGWRQKLEALRERPKPLVLQPKKSQLVPYGTPPSPVSKSCIQTPNRCERTAACNNPSRHGRRIQASPDGSAETTGDPRRQPNLGHPAFDPPDAHLKIVNVADRKDCSGHPLAVLNAANQKESLRHVTSSGSYVLDGGPDAVPECLNTFSDFYNPSVSADERFEKYLAEMHRREREVEATERLKVRNSSIGNFHYSKYSKKRRPFPLNGKKIPLHSGITQSLGNDLGAPDSDRNLSGLPRSKKPLAISTFSLLDIDKMRHKDGLGVPHTTR